MHKQDVAAALEHAAKVEVEQDDVIGGGAVGVGFFETKHQPTDDATKSFTDTADDVGTGIGNQSNARDDFAAKAFGANSPDVTVTPSAPKASNEYSVRRVGAASREIAAAEPLRTRSGRSYGKSTGPLLLEKHLVPDRPTSCAATGDGGARTEIYGEIDPEKIDDKEDVTEIVEIIDITPVDPFVESNFTDSERRSVYSSDESESEGYCRSRTENEDEIDSQPYCESSDTEGVGECFGSSTDNPSKSGYSQNPNEIACVLPETCSIQNDDEDFLFAMRIFERLKELSSDDRKNSVKVKIEKILMHNSNNTT